jgi:Mitochondrial carrier protein
MSQPTEPPLRQRVVAAAGAACVSVMLVNPLDVVKARVRAARLRH